MAKLIVELEGRRFIFRYSVRAQIIKMLEANAERIEDIEPVGPTSSRQDGGNADNGGPAIESSSPESPDLSPAPDSSDEEPPVEPEGDSQQSAGEFETAPDDEQTDDQGADTPLNDGTASKAAAKMIEEESLDIALIDAGGGKVNKNHVSDFIENSG